MKKTIGRVLYGLLFCAVIPCLLFLWSKRLDSLHAQPAISSPVLGTTLVAVGLVMMAIAMSALWFRGGGLPMNACPPPRFVSSGIYNLVPHPIYYGFTLACAGCSLFFGSAAGLWIATPLVAAGCAALVLGHELPDLRSRFGASEDSLWLPRPGSQKPRLFERLRLYATVLLPWLCLYLGLQHLGPFLGTHTTYLACEESWPALPSWEPLYASLYPVVILAPLLLLTGDALRRFAFLGLASMAVMFPLYVLLPFFVPPRPLTTDAAGPILRVLLDWERTPVSGGAAFPSYHALWALIVAEAVSYRQPRWRLPAYLYAIALALSCILTGMHSLSDVLTGAAVFPLLLALPLLWRILLSGCEAIANSWREWRFGSLRVINHGGWAALATVAMLLVIAALTGGRGVLLMISIYLCATVGAALWAQWVEGSPSLLRPLGFYGGMIGSAVGALAALPLSLDLWTVLAAICMGAPWMQAIGRLRCLVQGCCHGAATQGTAGIRYNHPRSRVCRLSDLGGRVVHATPLYSILCCVATGLILARIYFLGADATSLCACYLILSGLGRFVEEAYRGEPQTPVAWGLRLYQWIAVVTIAVGMAVACLRGPAMPPLALPSVASFLTALFCGAAAWFVTGMDFPESNRRFARLT